MTGTTQRGGGGAVRMDLWAAALVVLVANRREKKKKCFPPTGRLGPSLLYRSKLLASLQLPRCRRAGPTAGRFSAALRSGVGEGGGVESRRFRAEGWRRRGRLILVNGKVY